MQSLEYNDVGMNDIGNPDPDDSMQVDDENSSNPKSNSQSGSESEQPSAYFRTGSLLLATFPWFTTLPMVYSKLGDPLHGQEKYGFHLAQSLDNYDSFLISQNIHNSQLKAILRNVKGDPMADMTSTAISKREASMLRSKEKANEFCSLLCGYRLLDVIAGLNAVSEESTRPPVHKKMGINISKNERALRLLGNWTGVLQKFQHNFTSSKANPAPNIAAPDLPTRQLHALFQLHSNMTVDKSLINVQLAATHISFMLKQRSEENAIPDFPGTLQDFKALALRIPALANDDEVDHFSAFLERLAGDKHQIDNLRLPLQMALLISPIFLLQDAQIHLSTFYSQRYKMALYSKALGNCRPRVISELENIIWKQVLGVAYGSQTVYEAAANIVQYIPETFDDIDIETRSWFLLNSIERKEVCINLSSFHIEKGTIPDEWPLAVLLESGSTRIPSLQSMGSDVVDQENGDQNVERSAPKSKKKRPGKASAPSFSSAKVQKSATTSRRNASFKASQQSSASNRLSTINAPQRLPMVVGKTYLKVENIDLEELLAPKLKTPAAFVLTPESASNSSLCLTSFHSFNIRGERLEHKFATPFNKIMTAVDKFITKVEDNFTPAVESLCMEYVQTSAIKSISRESTQKMSPRSFQEALRSKHIIIADYNLPYIPCNRSGLMSLNSLKENVKIEDQSISDESQIKDGILKQFVENLELDIPNILRIIRMKSYSGAEFLPFASDHAAWRDTASDPYCSYETSEESSLRWTDASTANFVQFWKITPAGFGVFFDVRSGNQLIIIATPEPECVNDDGDKDFFTSWDRYLQDFDRLDPAFSSKNRIEAIRLEPGNRLILRPNTPYVVITLESAVVTGGFYLSTHTLYESLMGQINSFVLPSLLTEGKTPPLTMFVRRIVHYMHNAHVINDSSDRGHLLSFSSLDDARDLFSLITMAIYLNVFDERTYQLSPEGFQGDPTILQRCHVLFDLNAIPVVERHHLCYVRGLAFDLLNWFFENYSFSSVELEEEDIDAYATIFIPFVVHIGRQVVRYKRHAEASGHTTLSTCEQVLHQVQWAIFGFEFTKNVWLEEKAAEEERDYYDDADDDHSEYSDLDFDFSSYTIIRREIPEPRNPDVHSFLENGKTIADQRFFRGLTSQFNLDEFENLECDDSDSLSS